MGHFSLFNRTDKYSNAHRDYCLGHPGLTSQRHSALISSDSEYFQVCFSAAHYLKISEQRWFSSEQRWKRKLSELKISAETALFQRWFSLKQRWFRAEQRWFRLNSANFLLNSDEPQITRHFDIVNTGELPTSECNQWMRGILKLYEIWAKTE